LDARAEAGSIFLDGRWLAGISLGSLFAKPVDIRINMRVTGSCRADLTCGNGVIAVASLEGERFQARPFSVGCTLRDNTLSLLKLRDQLPFDFSFDYDTQLHTAEARLNCAELALRDAVTVSGTRNGSVPGLAVSGTAVYERGGDGSGRYRIDLAGGPPGGAAAGGSFAIRAGGDEKRTVIEEFRVSAPPDAAAGAPENRAGWPLRGNAGFRGSIGFRPLALEGVLSCANLSRGAGTGLSGEFGVNSRGREILVSGKKARIGREVLDILSVSLVPSGGELGFTLSARRSGGGEPPASLSLDGSFRYAPRRLAAVCAVRSVSAAALADMVRPFVTPFPAKPGPPLPAFAGGIARDILVSAEVAVSTDFSRFAYDAPGIELVFGSRTDGGGPRGIISLSGTDRSFDVSESRFVFAGNEILFSGYADYSNPMDIAFSLMTNTGDISYYAEGRVLERNQISVRGSHGFHAYLSSTAGGTYSGYVEGRDIPVPVRGLPARLGFFAQIRYSSPDFWSVDLDKCEVEDIAGPAGPGRLRISGGADQSGASFPALYYADSIGPLSGRADIAWNGNAGLTGTAGLEESPPDTDPDAVSVLPAAGDRFSPERYSLAASFAAERLSLLMSGSGMRLGRLFDNAYAAEADGDIRVTWDPERSCKAEINLNSLRAKWRERGITASASAALDSTEFTVRDLRLNAAGMEGFMPLLRLSLAESSARAGAAFHGSVGREQLEGSFAVDVSFAPAGSWPGIRNAFRSFSGLVRFENLRYAALAAGPFDVVFSRNGGELSVSGGPKDMLRLRVGADGAFYAGLSGPFPVRGSAAGTIRGNTIDARCPDLYVDLAALWKLLPPQPDIVLAGGIVNAQVEIRGPLADPEFFGSARGASVRARVPRYLTQDIRPIPFTVAIEGNEMRFGPVPAAVGKGAGTVSGVFRFDRWIPNIFTMDITVPRESPIPFGLDLTGFLAKGDASGRLRLSMADMILDVGGDLLVNNTEMGLKADEFNRGMDLFDLALVPVTVDLRITTGPSVEFLWPSSGFPILRANPAMGTLARITSDSVARQFTLDSEVKIRGGEIFYCERNFYIRSGTLSFRETERQFDPRLTVRAEIRDRTDDGPVTIAMIVDNAPLLSFTARFESNPSLSQAEIVALLGQNITGGQMAEASGSVPRAFLSSTSDVLAQFGVVRQLERQIRAFLRLDMFSIRTQALQNAIFSGTGLIRDPIDRNGSLGNYLDNTTVFLGKYIGSALFVQSMLSLRYDENNAANGSLRFEPEVGVEMETPLFNVRWDFVPAHPENWYVNDNSITLTWSKSF
jgi:hypothetical protein